MKSLLGLVLSVACLTTLPNEDGVAFEGVDWVQTQPPAEIIDGVALGDAASGLIAPKTSEGSIVFKPTAKATRITAASKAPDASAPVRLASTMVYMQIDTDVDKTTVELEAEANQLVTDYNGLAETEATQRTRLLELLPKLRQAKAQRQEKVNNTEIVIIAGQEIVTAEGIE